jgi:hypothetical protein
VIKPLSAPSGAMMRFGTMNASKKVRIALSSLALTVRAMVHGSFHVICLTSTPQDDIKAGQAARKSSLSQPGKAAKVDGTICSAVGAGGVTGGAGTGGVGGVTGGTVGTVGATGGNGVVVQAAKESAMMPSGTTKLLRILRRVNDIKGIVMWVLMIEAMVAFFLLVFIVWWTMYQGKKPEQHTQAAPEQKSDQVE